MGLDMYFIECPKGERLNRDNCGNELFYFRKHSDLNGFLQDLWLESHPGKTPDDFNCCYFRITRKVLDKMKELKSSLVEPDHYEGFLWGQSTEEDWKETWERCLPAIEASLDEGNKVYYHPWW